LGQEKKQKEADSVMAPKKYLSIFLLAAFALSAHACGRNERGEGAAEQAGKAIDRTLEKAGQETGKALERAGEKLQELGDSSKDTAEKPAPAAPPPNR
jgi:hypothetical protein